MSSALPLKVTPATPAKGGDAADRDSSKTPTATGVGAKSPAAPKSGKIGPNDISSPHELTAFVETLLEQLDSKFDEMSSQILDRMSQMSTRVDALEATAETRAPARHDTYAGVSQHCTHLPVHVSHIRTFIHLQLSSPFSPLSTLSMNTFIKHLSLQLPNFRRRRSRAGSNKHRSAPTLPAVVILPGVLDISKAANDALDDAVMVEGGSDWLPFEVTFGSPGTSIHHSQSQTLSVRADIPLPPSPAVSRAASTTSSRRLPVQLPVPPMPTIPSPKPSRRALKMCRKELASKDGRAKVQRSKSFPLSRRRTHTLEMEPLPQPNVDDQEERDSVQTTQESMVEAFPLPPRATFTKRLSPQALLRRSVTGRASVVSDDTEPLVIVKRASAVPRDSVGPSSLRPTSASTMNELLESLDDVYAALRAESNSSHGSEDSEMVETPPPNANICIPKFSATQLPPLAKGTIHVPNLTLRYPHQRVSSLDIGAQLAALPASLDFNGPRVAPYSVLVQRLQSIRSFGMCAPASRSLPDLLAGIV
uniref:Uncharacterized protein n=1 Tax=Mycena chlorophos TaxID=658473 RepID=A0ABQ0M4Z7_MYCCL|nr:predicted protein [Mycena chlorophos]